MTFNQAAINKLISNISSEAKTLGVFQQVLAHEPKDPPARDLTLAFWVNSIRPSTKFSGLNATAGVVTFTHRIYVNAFRKPEDGVEQDLLKGLSTLMGGYSGEFSFGGTVIAVDLLGMEGTPMSATTGYVTIGQTPFRFAGLTVPIVIDSLWTQTA